MSTHIKVLQKRGLAQDYIVADLDESLPMKSTENQDYNLPQQQQKQKQQQPGYLNISSQTEMLNPISDLHRDEDLETGNAVNNQSTRKSNLSESQIRELSRLGLICSDSDMMSENLSLLTPRNELIQRTATSRRGR